MGVFNTTVVVIGAGISGLKAAAELSKCGVSFEVLEGRDRKGGRLHSVDLDEDGHKIDIGASWFHDTLSNELFDEIVNDGRYSLYYDDGEPTLITNEGIISDKEKKLSQVTKEIIKFIELEYFEKLDQKDVSLRDKITEYLRRYHKLLSDDQLKYSPELLRYLELWHGVGWDQMSSKYATVDNVGRNCLITDGYSSVVDKVSETIPLENIHLSTVVNKIERKSSSQVIVSTSNGDTFTAKYCIVTVPQSVLKLSSNESAGITWEPKLPVRITDALDKMHFGSLGKFIFVFDEIFWDEHTDRFHSLAMPDTELFESVRNGDTVSAKPLEGIPGTWDAPVLLLNLYTSYKVPALLTFTQGDLTTYLEQNPDKAWDHMKPIIEKISNVEKIPSPKKVISSSWTQDPFSRGSYAACYPEDDPTDLIIQLSRGLDNVRFAGEHTILDGAGAVHGAWLSGRREADYILIKMGLKEGDLEEFL